VATLFFTHPASEKSLTKRLSILVLVPDRTSFLKKDPSLPAGKSYEDLIPIRVDSLQAS
jgi:hypothetical protein